MFTLYFVFRYMVIYKHLSSFQKEHQFLFSALKAGFSHDSRDDERDEKDEKDDESIEEIYFNEHSKADVYVNFWKYVVCFHKKKPQYLYSNSRYSRNRGIYVVYEMTLEA